MEDRHDRRAVTLVEVDQQFHDVDLMPDVQVRRRFVEDEDRRGLGDGHGHEHQLPLAERQRACVAPTEVTGADALDRGIDGQLVREPRAGERRLVGKPAERDDLFDGHREGQLGELGDDRDRAGDRLAADRLELGPPTAGPSRCPA